MIMMKVLNHLVDHAAGTYMALRAQERERSTPCPLAQTMSYAFCLENLPKLDLQLDRGADFKASKSQWDT